MAPSGDSHGWVLEAVDLYELPLRRYARRLLGDFDLAADAVQHAFVKLCEQSQAGLEGRVAPWLFRVCRNKALDHLRRAGREQAIDDELLRPSSSTATPVDRGAGDPATTAERAEIGRRVLALVRELPAAQREALDLWCEGFASREIAEITGRSEGHVRVLVHRGLAGLRSHPLVQSLLTADQPLHSRDEERHVS
jgi:RNA polymerase sigma factor (sigma-70 family)